MTDDKIENLNRWIREHVTTEDVFDISSDFGMNYKTPKKEHKDIIREILMTMPDKNGYYTPPYN